MLESSHVGRGLLVGETDTRNQWVQNTKPHHTASHDSYCAQMRCFSSALSGIPCAFPASTHVCSHTVLPVSVVLLCRPPFLASSQPYRSPPLVVVVAGALSLLLKIRHGAQGAQLAHLQRRQRKLVITANTPRKRSAGADHTHADNKAASLPRHARICLVYVMNEYCRLVIILFSLFSFLPS